VNAGGARLLCDARACAHTCSEVYLTQHMLNKE
jgi:hypothetical protein